MSALVAAPVGRRLGAGGPGDRFESGGAAMSTDWATPDGWEFDIAAPTGLERALWGLVVVSLLGDVVTTIYGLHLGLSESNPIARSAIDGWGVVGMLALKAGAVAIALFCRQFVEDPYKAIVPAALAIPWTFAVLVNLYMISTVV